MILVIGDTHIPDRAEWLPDEIVEFLKDKKFDIVICTGDLTSEKVLNYLKSLGRHFYVVEGNMDYLSLPRNQIIELEELKIGVIHGHGIYPRGDKKKLLKIAEDMKVDVLISGHTHYPDVYFDDNKNILLLNPGSATGAWGGGGGSMIPSFMILRVKGRSVDIHLYELKERLELKSFSFNLR